MKIIILHGEDRVKSYNRLSKFIDTAKLRGWEIINDQFPNTPSLFGTERLIVYRDYRLLTKRDIENFDKFEGTLVVYHQGDIPQVFLKLMPREFTMEKYDVPKLLFVFLESLFPGNSISALKLLHEVAKSEAPELIMFFIVKHFRDLYWVKNDASSTGFPSWKTNKLKIQGSKFSNGSILTIIEKLGEIDIKVKQSQLNLLNALDLLMINQLK